MLIFVVACSKLLKRFVDSCKVTRNKAGFCSCFLLLVRITAIDDVGVMVSDDDGGGGGKETSANESSSTYFNSVVGVVLIVIIGEFVSNNSDRVDDEDNVEYEDGVGDGLFVIVSVVVVVVVVRKFFKFFKCCMVKVLLIV